MTIVADWDTQENKTFKERVDRLPDTVHDIFFDLEEKDQQALLQVMDHNVEWNKRYKAGLKLENWVLRTISQANKTGMKDIAEIILKERVE